ncbi:ABC transporter ATP-binding protein [Halorubrum sp. SY-15]|uniref:ABC transporter ATP-binding protein n=1 Tax=Halorubrum sp. SY-15 TaxID=3402277 RepID=UPI003EBD3304
MSDDAVASLSGVSRTYGGIAVLDSVTLDVGPGVTAVVGPNGSGKSTMLGLLAGAAEPTTGTVSVTDPSGPKPVGYLPQRVPFRDGFTARETLAFYARLVDADPDAALERVGLSDAAERPVEALSGGMRRLLGIAQATVGTPPLVVLDEPTSGLDPGMRERAFRTATRAATDGTAVVLSSHDLKLVDDHADGVVLLAGGQVAAAGSRGDLLDNYDVASVDELYRAVVGESVAADASPAVHVTGVSDR